LVDVLVDGAQRLAEGEWCLAWSAASTGRRHGRGRGEVHFGHARVGDQPSGVGIDDGRDSARVCTARRGWRRSRAKPANARALAECGGSGPTTMAYWVQGPELRVGLSAGISMSYERMPNTSVRNGGVPLDRLSGSGRPGRPRAPWRNGRRAPPARPAVGAPSARRRVGRCCRLAPGVGVGPRRRSW
jgi:hypothetical protein